MGRGWQISILLISFWTQSLAQEKEKLILVKPDLHFRTFWMNTGYGDRDLKEDYALGMSFNLGAVMSYTNTWKLHLGYRSFANVLSSDIWGADPVTGQANRYESGLFDLLNPKDRFFGKLETFSLEYSQSKFGLKVGRMGINTDWINGQDGRLSPTAVEGFKIWIAPDRNWRFSIWGIGRMSIRGSADWLSVENTIGIYPVGRAVSGKAAQYFGNIQSLGLGVLEIDRKIGEEAKLHFSTTVAQNIFSTYWLALEKNNKLALGTWSFGLQTGLQLGLGNGGNSISELRYKEPNDTNFALSGRIGWKNSRLTSQVNYTRIGGKGRWLSPREWGKDAWYTFIPRERNEGFESVDAVVLYMEYRLEKIPVSIYGHFGIHKLPEVDDAVANKYNFPSYRQLNIGVKFVPEKMRNFDLQLLLMHKEPFNGTQLKAIQVYNKVDVIHFNAILNWRWN